jgi:hypothetical protein
MMKITTKVGSINPIRPAEQLTNGMDGLMTIEARIGTENGFRTGAINLPCTIWLRQNEPPLANLDGVGDFQAGDAINIEISQP